MFKVKKNIAKIIAKVVMNGPLLILTGLFVTSFIESTASALELDWSGQFRAESTLLRKYSLDDTALGQSQDVNRVGQGGYYIPGGGAETANFQELFLKLRPKLVVNDNIYIKSEWWVGDPVYGFYGNAYPNSFDQRQFYSTQSRGSTITAQRFWAEFLSDIGTIQVGRAPLQWGLGLVWNAGDGPWDHYESTGDTIRLISKFGAFSFIPAITKYSMGNNVAGGCSYNNNGPTFCTSNLGGGGLSDYSLAFKYENPDDEFEVGLNFIKRIAGGGQDVSISGNGKDSSQSGPVGPGNTSDPSVDPVTGRPYHDVAGMNFNTWDIYGKKKVGKFNFSGEIPIVAGDLEGVGYNAFAIATEIDWHINDTWEITSKQGHAPGQPSSTFDRPDKYRAFFFNPNYKLGLIMFNYQLANIAGPNSLNSPNANASSLQSPYDNPIVNANYLALGGQLHAEKWHFHSEFITASALETAQPGQNFYNTWNRRYYTNNANVTQSKSLGSEIDFGTSFHWDEAFQFGLDWGWFFPGDFYKFSNTGFQNATGSVFAVNLKVGVTF